VRDTESARGGQEEEDGVGAGMYGWIWRHLPGNAWVRALISLVLVLAVVFVLFQYVFPWAEPLLPFNDVTVDEGSGATR
jgi:hypothetical protein